MDNNERAITIPRNELKGNGTFEEITTKKANELGEKLNWEYLENYGIGSGSITFYFTTKK